MTDEEFEMIKEQMFEISKIGDTSNDLVTQLNCLNALKILEEKLKNGGRTSIESK